MTRSDHHPARAQTTLRTLGAIAGTASALLIAGCAASGSPNWDASFGDAARAARAQQTLDPNAPRRNAAKTPPTDGRTMRDAIDHHGESFRTPPPSNVINIGVGGGSTGGSTN